MMAAYIHPPPNVICYHLHTTIPSIILQPLPFHSINYNYKFIALAIVKIRAIQSSASALNLYGPENDSPTLFK